MSAATVKSFSLRSSASMTRSVRSILFALLFALILVTFSCTATHVAPPNATPPHVTPPNVKPPNVTPPNVKPGPDPGPGPAHTHTITADSCSVSDVQHALNRAHDGYRVATPPGTC